MNKTQTKVIVLGCLHGGLATIRSLGRRGIPVIAVSHDPEEFGLYSKYAIEHLICPDPANTRALADFLVAHAVDWQGALLLETSDYYAAALSEHYTELSAIYHMITPQSKVTQIFLDKDKTYELAEKAGVPYPVLSHPRTIDELRAVSKSMQFPLMIKPIRSHEFVRQFRKKLFIAETLEELEKQFEQILSHQLDVVVQEIIVGENEESLESVSLYIDSHGVVRGELFNVKMRQIPPLWGVMRVGRSVPPIDDVLQYSLDLLDAVDFHGFADIEYKRDERDGLPKLIEVNIRLPQNLQMMIASGIDFPWLIYQDIVLNAPLSSQSFKAHYYIDMIHDLGYTLKREPRKMLQFGQFFKPYLSRHKTFAIFALGDLKPFFRALRGAFR